MGKKYLCFVSAWASQVFFWTYNIAQVEKSVEVGLRKDKGLKPCIRLQILEYNPREEHSVETSRFLLAKRIAENNFQVESPSFILVCFLCTDLPSGDI